MHENSIKLTERFLLTKVPIEKSPHLTLPRASIIYLLSHLWQMQFHATGNVDWLSRVTDIASCWPMHTSLSHQHGPFGMPCQQYINSVTSRISVDDINVHLAKSIWPCYWYGVVSHRPNFFGFYIFWNICIL